MEINDLKLTQKRQLICERFGLKSAEDILNYYPLRYEQYSPVHYRDFKTGERVTFQAELLTYPATSRFSKGQVTRFRVLYEEEELKITIFNHPWLKALSMGQKLVIVGNYEGNNAITAINVYTKELNEIIGITPVYSTFSGITQNEIRKLIATVLAKCPLNDQLPNVFKQRHQLVDYAKAIHDIHFPNDKKALSYALARLKYEEFLNFYLSLKLLNGQQSANSKKPKTFSKEALAAFIETLGFELTSEQKKAVSEIISDIQSAKPMYRLLQGDVGCGKTVVALIALYANYLAGYKGVMMAPTEILASQHYQSMTKVFPNLRILLLTSSIGKLKELKQRIADGAWDMIVGTHSLFSDDVQLADLGLIITDEQHRFGVKHRRKLKEKALTADFLSMSATPIPRTLASSIYGDLAISSIESLPLGRKGCLTKLIETEESALEAVKAALNQGRQVYIIAAAIEKNPDSDVNNVNTLYERYKEYLPDYKIAKLHGRMSYEETQATMTAFQSGEIALLIATTVVEVGVNVPNATVMVIYDAERFGLSQLHQLRGRIQRGDQRGLCLLMSDSSADESLKRLKILEKSNDGFAIAYEDLKLRGPGDILGTRQSGLPTLVLGNLFEDDRFIVAAKADAEELYNSADPECRAYCAKMSARCQID